MKFATRLSATLAAARVETTASRLASRGSALAFAALVTASSWCSSARAQSGALQYAIGVRNDIFETVPYAAVQVQTAAQTSNLLADGEAVTSAVPAQSGEVVTITLGEVTQPYGQTIGQTFTETMPIVPAGVDLFHYSRDFFQPLAVDVKVQSTADVAPSPFHTRWRIMPGDPNSYYSFNASIASLLTSREIKAYQDYEHVTFRALDYRVGVLIRVAAPVTIDSYGMILEIDASGHGFTSMPAISAILVANTLTKPGFQVYPVAWTNETAYVAITGTLKKGDNLVLLSPYGGVSTPASFAGMPTRFEGSLSIPVQDCTPTAPATPTGWSCTPTTPTSSCPVSASGAQLCTTNKEQLAKTCKGPGQGCTMVNGKRKKGSVSVEIGKDGWPVEVNLQGEYETYEETTDTWTAGNGNGCGQCRATFHYTLKCKQVWNMKKDKIIHTRDPRVHTQWNQDTIIPCASSYTNTTGCVDSYDTENTCDRTQCN